MTTATPNVFISYARDDGRIHAERLYSDLTKQGIPAWRDERSLHYAQDFTADIEKAIERATHVVVCLTPQSKNSEGYVRRELLYAILLKKPIIPLRFADIEPHLQIVNLIWIDCFGRDWTVCLQEILHRLSLPIDQLFDRFNQAAVFNDPFAGYLKLMYQQVIDYLDSTVFTLIPLHSSAKHDAVKSMPALFNSFKGASLTIKKSVEEQENRFDHFPDAFTHYGGRVLLLGEPGAGKTTTLMAFARDAIAKRLGDPTAPLPIVARITDWNSSTAPAFETWLGALAGEAWRAALENAIREGRALLALDGLDELGGERQDPQTYEYYDPRLRFMGKIPPNNQVLITCRVKDFADIGEKIDLAGAVTLDPLDDSQIREYLKDHPDLWEALHKDAALRDVARTPLLLSIFTYAYAEMGERAKELRSLTDSPGDLRDKIFRTYVERRYEHERLKPHAELVLDVDEFYDLMGEFAIQLLSSSEKLNKRALTYTKVKTTRLTDFVIKGAEEAVQLNVMVSGEEARFIHLLLRDHFACEWAMRHFSDARAGYREAAANVFYLLIDPRGVQHLIRAVKDPNIDVVKSALLSMGNYPIKEVLDCLRSVIAEGDFELQQIALRTVGLIGGEQGVEIIRPLLSHPDQRIRFHAYNTVLLLQRDGKIDMYRDMLNSYGHEMEAFDQYAERYRQEVLQSSSLSLERIIAASKHPLPNIRTVAAQLLMAFDDEATLPVYLQLLQDMHPDVRYAAILGLSSHKKKHLIDIDILIKALGDSEARVREYVAMLLGEFRDPKITAPLMAMLNDPVPSVRASAITSFAEIKDPSTVPALIKMLDDSSKDGYGSVSEEAAKALEEFDTPEARAALDAWKRKHAVGKFFKRFTGNKD